MFTDELLFIVTDVLHHTGHQGTVVPGHLCTFQNQNQKQQSVLTPNRRRFRLEKKKTNNKHYMTLLFKMSETESQG